MIYYNVDTTSYCQLGLMANGHNTHQRAAASNDLPLGTKIRLRGRVTGPGGYRLYRIEDRIGYGTSLDLWTRDCSVASYFGRRTTTFKIGWAK